MGSQLVGQPHHTGGRVVQHCGSHPGFLDGLVAVQQGRDPPQIKGINSHRPATQHHGTQSRIVSDGVHDGPPLHLNPGGEHLQRRHHVLCGLEDVKDRHVWAFEVLTQHKGQLHLDSHVLMVLVSSMCAPGVTTTPVAAAPSSWKIRTVTGESQSW